MTHFSVPLTICGDANMEAQTDVCVLHRPSLVSLVLVADRTTFNEPGTQPKAEPQVIAGAIAAFQFNNRKREWRGFPRLNAMTVCRHAGDAKQRRRPRILALSSLASALYADRQVQQGR
ncbi:hypothetical protein GALMADRAFT_254028 [Galerina marginata CBS 339.88]|uniref:Uncharacterized protein n=1 Tax=Galerina marginata (strain CBS 339.88) TaxID=685588 RepID=A0A067SL65_GALM3|nr:hypothetical protein GALMADRAFT_254028 [Galerina marginata CBS 339.88]